MLILRGTLKAATEVGGMKKRDGTSVPVRSVVQLETTDNRGLAALTTLTVPDHRPYATKIGEQASFPVRAYVSGNAVAFTLEERA